MSSLAIGAQGISKQYRIGATRNDTLRDALTACVRSLGRRAPHGSAQENIIWALRDVSFEVANGEALGIIGRNGAGKSTLLKILARITDPTYGFAELHGHVGSLLEVGTGFHPELTGRENVYLNGSILGMRRREIDRKFQDIVDFSGVSKFLDTPVKRYSSGMAVRLAFAVAAHLDPEILLVDEVLAVGDASFQAKCVNKVEGLRQQGTTVLLVSHNLHLVNQVCRRVIVLHRGAVLGDGAPLEMFAKYKAALAEVDDETVDVGNRRGAHPTQASPITISNVVISGPAGEPSGTFSVGDPFVVQIGFVAREEVIAPVFALSVEHVDGTAISVSQTHWDDFDVGVLSGEGSITFTCDALNLVAGVYYVNVGIRDAHGLSYYDVRYKAASFDVRASKMTEGYCYLPHDWTIEQK